MMDYSMFNIVEDPIGAINGFSEPTETAAPYDETSMPSTDGLSIEVMLKKATEHKAMLSAAKADIEKNKKDIEKLNEKVTELIKLRDLTVWDAEYLEKLINSESELFIKKLSELLDYGVKTIFYDCNYGIEIRTEDNRAEIHLVYEDDIGNKLDPDIRNCGGGIRTVIGFLMQIYFIFHYGVARTIFIDEGFSQISSQYIEPFFGLIKELAKSNDLSVVLITHDDRFTGFADKSFVIEDGKAKET